MLKPGIQEIAQPQNKQDDDCTAYRRQSNMPQLTPAAGPVDPGCFILLQIDTGQGGQENNRSPADFLPDGLGDNHRPEPFRLQQEGDFPAGEPVQELV
ncbi:hypothetical protein D3C86_1833980 [compost metagenome]